MVIDNDEGVGTYLQKPGHATVGIGVVVDALFPDNGVTGVYAQTVDDGV